MIAAALQLLKEELSIYLTTKEDFTSVLIENVATQILGEANANNHITITLLNIEEDKNAKNGSLKNASNNSQVYGKPSTYLNLYLLFTCHYKSGAYSLALKSLSNIILFFQEKSIFSYPYSASGESPIDEHKNLNFTMHFFTPSFEEVNQIWSSLGKNQLPAVIFKLNSLKI